MKNKKLYILYIFIFWTGISWAQNPALAKKYYDDGDLDKAIYEYKLLVNKFPYNTSYATNLISALQSNKNFKSVDSLIKKLNPKKKPVLWVYKGYNYQLQKDSVKAQKYYQKAIKASKKQSYYTYAVGAAFQKFYLLDQALQLYENAMQSDRKIDFSLQIAQIYAEKNQLDKTFEYYLSFVQKDERNSYRINYYLSKYITQDADNKANMILKNQLIQRIKADANPKWYRLLHWLYMQQKDYKKAFFQLKSLYRKDEAEMSEIYQLANTARFAKKTDAATTIYEFVIENSTKSLYVELSKLALLHIETDKILNQEEKNIVKQQFEQYINEGWSNRSRVALNLLYADFTAFHLKNIADALAILKNTELMPLSRNQKASVQLKKADIYLYDAQFNQSLVLYTQVQLDFPNNEMGHQATYKIAKSSFFKGDIDWAHSQLKVIKSVASDLIANDAIDLDLIIINNKEEGDTIQAGLKKYAKVRYEIYCKNPIKALQLLDSMKVNFKGQQIYDDVLYTQAQLFEQQNTYEKALKNYEEILQGKEDLFKDDALFRIARIYETELEDEEQAQKYYKRIIIEFPASYWFVDARKYYRKLRGDDI